MEVVQKEEKALQINPRRKQQQFEALQKEIEALQKENKDLSAAALKLVNIVVPIEPGTAPPSLLDRLRQALFELQTCCEALAKLCVKHFLALAKPWWPVHDIGLLSGINPDIPPQRFRELTDEVEDTAMKIVAHVRF